MGTDLTPERRALENLDKDAESRKSAMKFLKSHVKDLDSKDIHEFLAQLSEAIETGSSSGEFAIPLYEELARVHGVNIVPHIDNFMVFIIKTLSSSTGSFAPHHACSKVIPAIARYGIDPTTPEGRKREIIHSLCKPLSDCLLGSHESLSSGAALSLKALVDSDNWRFASNEMVNEVCLRVAGTLQDKPKQTNSHIGLVMALADHNSLIVEPYARCLISSGLKMLKVGAVERNSQKRLSAIQMVKFLMENLDSRSISSELPKIVKEMENCQSDQMAYVGGAAFEALQTARKMVQENGFKDASLTSQRRNQWSGGERSSLCASPESQILDPFECESPADSPPSANQVSCCLDHNCNKPVNQKLCKHENGRDNFALKDGFYSKAANVSLVSDTFSEHSGQEDVAGDGEGYRSATPSPPLRSCSQINAGDFNIYTTPRRLIHSLQEPDDAHSGSSERLSDLSPTPYARQRHPASKLYQNGFPDGLTRLTKSEDGSESVSSTDGPAKDPDPMVMVTCEVGPEQKLKPQDLGVGRIYWKKTAACGLLVLLVAVLVFMQWGDSWKEERSLLVPT